MLSIGNYFLNKIATPMERSSETPKTVRDIKNEFERRFGHHHRWTKAQQDFWGKLNSLGERNTETHRPDQYPDIDATVQLSDNEIIELQREMTKLLILSEMN